MRMAIIGFALIAIGIIMPLIYLAAVSIAYPSPSESYGGAIIVFPIPVALVFGNGGPAMALASMLSIVLLIAFIVYMVLIILTARRSRGSS
ncbi:hypothetical protein GCM10007981_07140 [Thermocladium modestius]|uniref:DUF131 domain-containing protein n=1 Tax=Thermocladium modestius TaxID=62609 RepID=A0A830GUG8_9CREN|nr:hypothetical protein [Thermocladium modestius]GGP20166.1 hypothetical protein GCM10007981_07140 [Thermocladium modestius]